MKKLAFLILLILGAINLAFPQMPFGLDKVREIKPLESSRDDVRSILADYKLEENENQTHLDSFNTGDAQIRISYAEAKCDDDEDEEYSDWNVPEWKVIDITIDPESSTKFSEIRPVLSNLGTKLSKFKKEKSYDNIDSIFLYHNKDLGIAIEVENDEINAISFSPAKKYYFSMCNQKLAKKLWTTKSWFITPLKNRYVCILQNNSPDVENIILSFSEITASCPLSDLSGNKSCSGGVNVLAVFAAAKDPENDVLTYSYTVSGGRIIGQGAKVIWDLSDVKPGTYTITAAADDGCGFCGKPLTKTVVVKECLNCKK